MLKTIMQTLAITVFFSTLACAEQPAIAVPQNPKGGTGTGVEGVDKNFQVELKSLVYEGRDPFGGACTLFLSGVESGEGAHSLSLMTKVVYSIHGVNPLDMQAQFYRYNRKENLYYESHGGVENTTPALAAALLSDSALVPDMNQLTSYEQELLLLQSMRVDFADFDIEAFEVGLKTVLQDNTALAAQSALLDQMDRAILKIKHFDHYDASICSDFQLGMEMQSVVYQLNKGVEEDHDHDHDDHDDEGDDADHSADVDQGDHDHDHDHN